MNNQVDFKKQNFKKGHALFCRKTLIKTILYRGKAGVFAVISKVLDRDTLTVRVTPVFYYEESLARIVFLFLKASGDVFDRLIDEINEEDCK